MRKVTITLNDIITIVKKESLYWIKDDKEYRILNVTSDIRYRAFEKQVIHDTTQSDE